MDLRLYHGITMGCDGDASGYDDGSAMGCNWAATGRSCLHGDDMGLPWEAMEGHGMPCFMAQPRDCHGFIKGSKYHENFVSAIRHAHDKQCDEDMSGRRSHGNSIPIAWQCQANPTAVP